MDSFYDALNEAKEQDIIESQVYLVDEDQTIVPNCKVRLNENGIIGTVLWITEEGFPVVRVEKHNMRMRPEGLTKLKINV